ncbi:hypothetical protein AKJ09_10422 [Labilithrix luteola]|uniref:Uncharacterized protein n=1 Tax=Labilithrix luteola TaxID=1391654 RepID=A0A0K1QDC6_9BACT|nr:hypothetical protein AKJ09_10422 [Labilithrix luteola]
MPSSDLVSHSSQPTHFRVNSSAVAKSNGQSRVDSVARRSTVRRRASAFRRQTAKGPP